MKKIFYILIVLVPFHWAFGQSLLFHENFEPPSGADSVIATTTGNLNWAINTTYAASGTQSYHKVVEVGDSSTVTTMTFSASGIAYVGLSFRHICKIHFLDKAEIYVSINNGVTWIKLTGAEYLGNATFGAYNNTFTSVSYPEWQPGVDTATPSQSWWKEEFFNISQLVSQSTQIKVMFMLRDGDNQGAHGSYGWLIDDIKVLGGPSEMFPPSITLLPPVLPDTTYSTGPFPIRANITDPSGIDTAYVIYTLNGGIPDTIGMAQSTANEYFAMIPSYTYSSLICYSIVAFDGSLLQNKGSYPASGCESALIMKGDSVVTIGTGILVNSSTTYPAPYGNRFRGARHQFLIPATELNAAGLSPGHLVSLAFEVVATQGTPLQGFTIQMGHSSLNTLATTFTETLQTVYSVTSYTEVSGWNTHAFQTPFYWNGVDNLIVETCFNNTTSTNNATVRQTATTYASSLYYRDNISGICSRPTGTLGYQRPNMRFETAQSNFFNDAGVSQILLPIVPGTNTYDLQVRLRNYGTDTLVKAQIYYSINSGPAQGPVTWTGSLLPGVNSALVYLNTLNVPYGYISIAAWTSLPNDSLDQNTVNDELINSLYICPVPFSGAFNIAGSNADFQSVNAAVQAMLTCGLDGPVEFYIAPGTYTGQFKFPMIPTASEINTITFRSSTGDHNDVVFLRPTTAGAGNYTISFNNAQYITLKQITGRSTSTTYGKIIVFEGNCRDITIDSCLIDAPIGTANTIGPFSTIVNSVDTNITISNSTIKGGLHGIHHEGAAQTRKYGISVINNVIQDFYGRGITVNYADSVFIRSNQITNRTTSALSAIGISVENTNGIGEIYGNKVHMRSSGTQTGIYVAFKQNLSFDYITMANNFVTQGGTGGMSGLFVTASNYVNVYHNSVNIVAGSSDAMFHSGGSNINILNNILSNTSTGTGYAFRCNTPTAITVCNFNNLYRTGSNFTFLSGTAYSDLPSHQAANLMDLNSHSLQPPFSSPIDLYLTSPLLSKLGMYLSSIPDDIDGLLRTNPPTIGGHEVPFIQFDAGITAILYPDTTSIISQNDLITPEVVVTNFGSDTIMSMTIVYTINHGNPINTAYIGPLLPAESDTVSLQPFLSPAGPTHLTVYTILAGDSNTFNDTSYFIYNGIQSIDGSLTRFIPIEGLCNMGTDTLKIMIANMSIKDTISYLTASYQITGSPVIYTDTVQLSILPFDSAVYHFSTLIDLTVTGADSIFDIKAWINVPGDNFQSNDTLTSKVRSGHTPDPPLVADVQVPYGSNVTLTAQSSHTVQWYQSAVSTSTLATGNQYPTPFLFDTTTYWVEASTAIGHGGLFTIGTASTNSSVTGPIMVNDVTSSYVYSNHITILQPAELSHLNGYLSSLSWYKSNTNSYPTSNGQLRIYLKHTSLNTIPTATGTFANQMTGATMLYESTTQSIPLSFGWQEFAFNTGNEFLYNGTSNLMILVEWYRPGSATGSITWNFTQTSGKAQTWAGASNPPTVAYGAGERPNIRVSLKPMEGCNSNRVPITALVGPPPPVDAGVINIVSPAAYVLTGNTALVEVQVKNYGWNDLTSVEIHHSINGVMMTPYSLTGINLPKDSITLPILLSVNTLPPGSHTLKVWTSMPNGVIDTVNTNDTLTHNFPVCLGGIYTLGTITSDFPTFSSAINALLASPICTHVVFNVEPGVYNLQLDFPVIPNLGPDATATFQSITGDSTDVVIQFSTTSANNRVLLLNGTQHVAFHKMTFHATGLTQGRVVEFLNSASNITFSNCVIKTSNTSTGTAFAGVICDFQSVSQNVLFENNHFVGGYYGVAWTGNTGYIKNNITIKGNHFDGFFSAGLFLRYIDSLYIHSNTFSNRLGSGLVYGIYLQYMQGFGEIMKNRINIQGSNVQYAMFITEKTIGSTQELTIANNFITTMGSSTTTYGILISNSPHINLYYNSVNIHGGDGTNGRAVILSGSGVNIRIKNNIMANYGGGYSYYVDGTATGLISESNHNNFYSTGQYPVYWGTPQTSLVLMQALSGKDANSIAINPLFTSLTNLTPLASGFYQAGVSIAGITDDIFGNPRPGINPCIGAVEFAAVLNDAGIEAITHPGNVVSGLDSVVITLKNAGANPLTSVDIHWQVNGQLQTPLAWTGNLASNASQPNVTLGTFPFTFGSNDLIVWVSQPNGQPDGYSGNDTLKKSIAACSGALRGTYTLGGSNADFNTFSSAVNALKQCGVDSATVFLINTGVYFENIEITMIQGASALNTITFRSALGDSAQVLIQHSAISLQDAHVIYLNGAKHIHFKQISIKGGGPIGGRIVLLRNGADYNSFEGCVIEAPVTNSSLYSCVYSDNSSADQYNVFKGNRILNGYHGMHIVGSATNRKTGFVIENNQITGYYYYGIYALYTDSLLITKNTLTNSTPVSNTGNHIWVYYNQGYAKINKNKVHSTIQFTSAGIAYGYPTSVPSIRTEISNNFVSQSGAATAFRGIAIYGINCRVNILNNSVSVTSHSTNSTSLYLEGGQNNIFCNNIAHTGAQGYALRADSADFISASDFNNFFTTGSSYVFAGVNHADLATYQLLTNLDSNSVFTDPMFYGIDDLHSNSPVLDGAGKPLPGIFDDIDGDMRDPIAPDIGADEFTLFITDIGPIVVLSPTLQSSYAGATMSVEVRIRNHGAGTVNTFDVAYTYGNLPPVSAVWNGQLFAGQTIDYVFSVPLNLLTGLQALKIYTTMSGDMNSFNDTISLLLTGQPVIPLPWSDNFDSIQDFWTKSGFLWQRGQPGGNVINAPYSNPNVWATNLIGHYTSGANEWLYSPFFNFSFSNGAIMSFWHWYDILDNNDGGQIQMSMNGGATWLTIGFSGDPLSTNWYNHIAGGQHYFTGSSNGWVLSSYDLSALNQTATPVQFRFRFFSNISGTSDGWAIDNFSISMPTLANDAALQFIDQPTTSTVNGSQVTVQATIRNMGTTTLTFIPLGYRVNNQPVVNETWTGTLLTGSTTTFTFSTTYTSPNLPYSLCVFTKLAGDQNPLNDTLCSLLNTTLPPFDAGIESILQPTSTSIAQSQVTVTARIRNYGSQNLNTIPVVYNNGTVQSTETWSGVLLPGASVDYTFPIPFTGPLGAYTLCVRTQLVPDGDTTNDQQCVSVTGVIGIEEAAGFGFRVHQNRPNPAGGMTEIEVFLPDAGEVIFTLTAMQGIILRHMVEMKPYGAHNLIVDLDGIPPGIYLYSVEFKGERVVKKMIVL
jgi:hypothetical protein